MSFGRSVRGTTRPSWVDWTESRGRCTDLATTQLQLAGRVRRGEEESAVEQVRIGVSGLGMGRNHAVNYRDAPEADLVAICDVSAERVERVSWEVHPRKKYTDYHELLADPEIEAVTIALPNALHAPVVMEALEAGKHVL